MIGRPIVCSIGSITARCVELHLSETGVGSLNFSTVPGSPELIEPFLFFHHPPTHEVLPFSHTFIPSRNYPFCVEWFGKRPTEVSTQKGGMYDGVNSDGSKAKSMFTPFGRGRCRSSTLHTNAQPRRLPRLCIIIRCICHSLCFLVR